ncbi:MAG: threonylcarbamoyl-AMP synthase [Myxococcales bacterium]|nr:threonylcarbamoyl-AMP synthase [Myxococcales bacterium]
MLKRLSIEAAVAVLKQGGVVVFPTETSYGIGCRASDADAVARVVHAKGRPDGKPLPVLLPSVETLRRQHLESPLVVLAEAFWPGPLTLVVPAFPGLPPAITADTNMVGVRVSAHPIAQSLVKGLGEPLVATSANRSGQPAAASVAECDAAGLIGVDGLVAGDTVSGTSSTVVGLDRGDLRVHRHGPITEAMLRAVWEPARSLN